MKQKTFKSDNLYIILLLIFTSIVISSYVAGPPPMSTNAPGETTCATTGACHVGTPNTGLGFGEMTAMDSIIAQANFYMPDSTYVMMPYMMNTGDTVLGFQAVAKLTNGNSAGTVTITMPMKTQSVSSGGQEYVSQTKAGAAKPGMHDWMYDWQAPPAGSGTVTFYVAFISGDADSTTASGSIYTDTLVLYEGPTGIKDVNNTQKFLIERIYPVPAKDFVNIDFKTDKRLEISISVIDINGKLVVQETPLFIDPSVNSYKLNLKGLSAGNYFVEVKQNDKPALQRKIVKY